MFTGIIEELGVVTSLIRGSQAGKLTISVSRDFANIKVGESVAINGVCLTVTGIRRNFIEFDISSETLKKSSLSELKIGDKVNLEKALLVSGRLGGHMVTGHVDGVGEIRNKIDLGKGFELHVSIPSELLRYLVPKGSIALDGVSLTIADLRNALLVASVVPHTVRSTNLGAKNIGDRVNIEVDVLSKYIERHLKKEMNKGITEDTLTRVGFLPMGWIDN
jgi:riboflavin synthase